MSRIAVLLPNLVGGGVERVRLTLAQEFAKEGHEVEFVLMQARGQLLGEARSDFSVVELATSRFRDLRLSLSRYLRERRPTSLLAGMWPLTAVAPLAARLSGHRCKTVVSEHNTLSVQYRDWGRVHRAAMRASMAVGYRLADHRVAVSGGVAGDIATLSGMPAGLFKVIHNPIPVRPAPSPEMTRQADAMWSSPRGQRIVTVGSMKAQKNHPLLLQAFSRVAKPGARLMFVGEGAGREDLAALAGELDVADQVIFAGFHSDPTPFYKTADLFVLSSDYEGFGNVIVEAMACGTSVVSTDCPSGPGEILDGGRYGRLVPVGDVHAMARAIEAGLQDPTPEAVLLSRARDFAPDKAAARYLELLGLA